MMKYFSDLRILLIMFLFGAIVLGNAQIMDKSNRDIIVFGKVYTKEELKKSNGFIRCASTEYEQMLQKNDPSRMTDAEFEAWLSPLIQNAMTNKSQSGGIITIPVVVHVIHSGQAVGVAPNITDNQVISQITVMNQDYRKMAGTPGFNTNPVGADVMIQFALAKVDPNGNPTNGINRVNLCNASWSTGEVDSIVKPQTQWDPTQYMNMWSVNFSDSTLLGYAQFPSNSTIPMPGGGAANTDGVVANYSTFGSIAFNDGTFILNAPYNLGRTMTHEVGHFLGLRHIWGDNASCTVDATDSFKDYCPDTPAAAAANYGCPTIDSCPTATGNDMVQNYMDYSNDSCMNIFTNDQKTRITTVMNNSPRRVELKTSTKDMPIPLFPNDAELRIEKSCAAGGSQAASCSAGTGTSTIKFTIYNRGTSTLTSAVISYSVAGGATQTHTWTGSLAQDKFSTFDVTPAAGTPSGAITASITTANGVADQRTSNNNATGTYSGTSAGPVNYQFSTVVFRLQCDAYGNETTWNLKNSSGATLYSGGPYTQTAPNMPALITQTWNLTPNACYEFTITDSYGDGFNGGYGAGYFDLKSSDGTVIIYSKGALYGNNFAAQDKVAFKIMTLSTNETTKDNFDIYPIPVIDILNVTKVSSKATYQVHDAAGRLVDQGTISRNQINVSKLTAGNYILTVKDEVFNGSVKFIKK